MHWRSALAGSLILTGCTSLPWNVNEPKFAVKEDIFQNVPAWESDLFKAGSAQQAKSPDYLNQLQSLAAKPRLLQITSVTSPGLYSLLRQVDPGNRMLSTATEEMAIRARLQNDAKSYVQLSAAKKLDYERDQAAVTLADENDKPLTDEIRQEPLARAYVICLAAAYYNGRLRTMSNSGVEGVKGVPLPKEYSVDEVTNDAFTVQNFLSFGRTFLHSNLDFVQKPNDDNKRRLRAISQMAGLTLTSVPDGGNPPHLKAATAGTITLQGLMFQYYVAYYKGNFVDRDGGQLAKPALGTTISDTTLANAATVALDSMFDFAVLAAAPCGDKDAIKAPVLYEKKDDKVTWQTANGGKPTLVAVVEGLWKFNGSDATVTQGNNGTTLSLSGSPTGGTFVLTVGVQQTQPIRFNAPAADVQAAVVGAAPGVTVTGSPGGPYLFSFAGGNPPPVVTADGSKLTGGTDVKPLTYVLEPLADTGKTGIDAAKIKVIRYVQGIAGDGAQGLSGVIMRTFGGVHVGVAFGAGILGKVSIGDNNTLASLLESAVGTMAARSSELFSSNVLYDMTYSGAPNTDADPPVVLLLKYLQAFGN